MLANENYKGINRNFHQNQSIGHTGWDKNRFGVDCTESNIINK